MVKIFHDPGPLEDPYLYFTTLMHFGGRPWESDCRHYVYAYFIWDLPAGAMGLSVHPTIVEALAEARAWAALPAIPRFLCDLCRLTTHGPRSPHWNIYRGENRLIVPKTYFWDVYQWPYP